MSQVQSSSPVTEAAAVAKPVESNESFFPSFTFDISSYFKDLGNWFSLEAIKNFADKFVKAVVYYATFSYVDWTATAKKTEEVASEGVALKEGEPTALTRQDTAAPADTFEPAAV